MTKLSSQSEDYLERMLEILQEKGTIRAVELAERLGVTKGSVSQMIQKLEKEGHVNNEKYRGFHLTASGKQIAQSIRYRHEVLEEFFNLLKIPKHIQEKDIEGIEHNLSQETLHALEKLVRKLKKVKKKKS